MMEVTMFQMGFGESILLHQDDSCLLVDCGSESKHKQDYFDNVNRELRKYPKRSLLISHFHSDHINGISDISKQYPGGFGTVYVPNIFGSGDRALDLLITQYLLEGVLNRHRKVYHIWDLLLALVQAKLSIFPIMRGTSFSAASRDFQTLWPIPNDPAVGECWEKVKDEVKRRNLLVPNTEDLASQTKQLMRTLLTADKTDEVYAQSKDKLEKLITQFEEAQLAYIEIIKQGIGIKKFKSEIQELYQKISSINETSIIFQTADESQPQILMTGDILPTTMEKIAKNMFEPKISIKPHYDILKAPHHGTGSSYCLPSLNCSLNRLLISNGETPRANRGAICNDYLSSNSVKYVICTNTVRKRCEYMEKHNQCADVCVDCRTNGLHINCAIVSNAPGCIPEIIWNPAGEENFKNALLKTRRAKIIWEYSDGRKEERSWKADDLITSSDVRNNIQSRDQWRAKDNNGLVRVYVEVI